MMLIGIVGSLPPAFALFEFEFKCKAKVARAYDEAFGAPAWHSLRARPRHSQLRDDARAHDTHLWHPPRHPVGGALCTHPCQKARPTKVSFRPEWRRAGVNSARGCPGRHLGVASLGQSASWAALADHIGLAFDIG
eukprot:scaffold54685_cov63-Phaeocystis_antarctica.AAC.3